MYRYDHLPGIMGRMDHHGQCAWLCFPGGMGKLLGRGEEGRRGGAGGRRGRVRMGRGWGEVSLGVGTREGKVAGRSGEKGES